MELPAQVNLFLQIRKAKLKQQLRMKLRSFITAFILPASTLAQLLLSSMNITPNFMPGVLRSSCSALGTYQNNIWVVCPSETSFTEMLYQLAPNGTVLSSVDVYGINRCTSTRGIAIDTAGGSGYVVCSSAIFNSQSQVWAVFHLLTKVSLDRAEVVWRTNFTTTDRGTALFSLKYGSLRDEIYVYGTTSAPLPGQVQTSETDAVVLSFRASTGSMIWAKQYGSDRLLVTSIKAFSISPVTGYLYLAIFEGVLTPYFYVLDTSGTRVSRQSFDIANSLLQDGYMVIVDLIQHPSGDILYMAAAASNGSLFIARLTNSFSSILITSHSFVDIGNDVWDATKLAVNIYTEEFYTVSSYNNLRFLFLTGQLGSNSVQGYRLISPTTSGVLQHSPGLIDTSADLGVYILLREPYSTTFATFRDHSNRVYIQSISPTTISRSTTLSIRLLDSSIARSVRPFSPPLTLVNDRSCSNVRWVGPSPSLLVACEVPDGVGINVPLIVRFTSTTNSTVTYSASTTISYLPPYIISIAPENGPCVGNTTVVMTLSFAGSSTDTVSLVTGNATISLARLNDTHFTFQTPPATDYGSVNWRVTTGGQLSNSVQFTYDSPVFYSVSPGPFGLSGGEPFNITGKNFGVCESTDDCGTNISIMMILSLDYPPFILQNVKRVSDSLIIATTPAGYGVTNVTVFINAGSFRVLPNQVAYSKPVIESVNPQRVSSGEFVSIRGQNFAAPIDFIRVLFRQLSNDHALTFECLKPTMPADGLIVCTVPMNLGDLRYAIFVVVGNLQSDLNPAVFIRANDENPVPRANDLSAETLENNPAVIGLAGSDVDGEVLTFSILSLPRSGTLYQYSGSSTNSVGNAFTQPGRVIDAQNHVVYLPNQYYNGRDQFTYQAVDPLGGLSAAATVRINVQNVNQHPVFAQTALEAKISQSNTTAEFLIRVSDADEERSIILYAPQPPSRGEWYLNDWNTPVNFQNIRVPITASGEVRLFMRHDGLGGGKPYTEFELYAQDTVDPPSASLAPLKISVTVQCPPTLPNNVWSNQGSVCEPCPEGGICSQNGDFAPFNAAGYFHIGNGTFVKCNPPESCMMGSSSGNTAASMVCTPGYKGLRCGQCDASYYRLGALCVPCAAWLASPVLAIFLLLLACVVVIGVFALIRKYDLGFLSMLTTYLQALAILTKSKIAWPEFVDGMFNVFSFLNFNVELASPECYDTTDTAYEAKFYATLVAPVIIGLVILSMLGTRKLYYYIQVHRKGDRLYATSMADFAKGITQSRAQLTTTQSTDELRQSKSALALDNARISSKNEEVEEEDFKKDITPTSQILAVLLLILKTLYLTLARKSVEIFDCPYDRNSALFFFKPEPSRKCFIDDWWFGLLPISIIASLVYLIGIPAVFAYLLYQRLQIKKIPSDERTERQNTILMITFKRKVEFKPGNEYWDVITMIRELCIVLTQLFFASYTGLQACALLLIFLIATIFSIKRKPYVDETMNFLESMTLSSCTFVLLAGIAFQIGEMKPGGRAVLGGLVVAVVSVSTALVVYNLFIHIQRNFKVPSSLTVQGTNSPIPKIRTFLRTAPSQSRDDEVRSPDASEVDSKKGTRSRASAPRRPEDRASTIMNFDSEAFYNL